MNSGMDEATHRPTPSTVERVWLASWRSISSLASPETPYSVSRSSCSIYSKRFSLLSLKMKMETAATTNSSSTMSPIAMAAFSESGHTPASTMPLIAISRIGDRMQSATPSADRGPASSRAAMYACASSRLTLWAGDPAAGSSTGPSPSGSSSSSRSR